MKPLLFLLILSSYCSAQNSSINYIIYNNFTSEAEYHFHEGEYNSAIYYYELGLAHVEEPSPSQHYKYAKALWKTGDQERALEEIVKTRLWRLDTNWFSGLNQTQYDLIHEQLDAYQKRVEQKNNINFYQNFIDSISKIDQDQRNRFSERMDSLTYIEPYPTQLIDSIGPIWWETVEFHDSCNAEAIIKFTKAYGFPGGKQIGWNHTPSSLLLHMEPEWFVENYILLYQEVVKGNLESWMLANGIDRMFTVEIGEEKINPYNCYWKESIVDPFLMFYNCVSLGVSPYYTRDGVFRKSINFEYYQEHKKHFNTTFQYAFERE